MPRPRQTIIEYRSYELQPDFPILLLAGERWHISDIKSGRLHFHNCLEVGVCHSDSGIIEFYGAPRHFHAGDVTCIARNVPHTTYSSPGEASLWTYLFFSPQELLRSYFQNMLPGGGLYADMLQDCNMILPSKDYPEIHQLALMIIREMEQKPMNYKVSVRGLCLGLLMAFLRIYAKMAKKPDEKKSGDALPIAPALDYIHANYMYDFPVEYLADLCHLSPTHFRRTFHSIMEMSPLKFIHTTRILESCTLLRSTEENVTTISEQVGYGSVSSYNRHFTDFMGCAPNLWRRTVSPIVKPSILEYTGWF